MMKKTLLLLLTIVGTAAFSYAQFKELVVEKIDNKGLVPGNTYRVYALMTNATDHVHAVYATGGHPMKIESTKPFYQHPYGGATTSSINAALLKDNPKLAYDSWVTIGMDSGLNGEEPKMVTTEEQMVYYENTLNTMTLDLRDFEAGNALVVEDGAWFCIPTMTQIQAGADRKVLLMQLTSEGEISGLINIQGMHGVKESFQAQDLRFTCK